MLGKCSCLLGLKAMGLLSGFQMDLVVMHTIGSCIRFVIFDQAISHFSLTTGDGTSSRKVDTDKNLFWSVQLLLQSSCEACRGQH